MTSLRGDRVVTWGPHQDDLDSLGQVLTRRGFRVRPASSLEELRASIHEQDVDLVFAQLGKDFERPLELLAWLREVASAPPVVIVTDGRDVGLYLEAMRRGAFDCVGVPLDENEVLRIATRALETRPQPVPSGGVKP